MTPDQRDAMRKMAAESGHMLARLYETADVLWLLDAADQRDRAVELLQETVSWPSKDWQERRDALLAELGATR